MKIIFAGLLVLLLAGLSYIVFVKPTAKPVLDDVVQAVPIPVAEEVTLVGEVLEVDFEKVIFDGPSLISLKAAGTEDVYTIAVPSASRPTCIASSSIADPFQLAPGDRLEVRGLKNDQGEVVPCSSATHYLTATRTEVKSKLGFAFTYRKGPAGYVLEENTLEVSDATLGLLYSAVFTNTEEYAAFLNAVEVREGPEQFSIRVYENDEQLQPAQWIEAYSNESKFTEALSEPVEVVVAGKKAILYTVDGLYPIEMYVVTDSSFVYLVTGMFNEATSVMGSDFATFVASLKFVPVESGFLPS